MGATMPDGVQRAMWTGADPFAKPLVSAMAEVTP